MNEPVRFWMSVVVRLVVAMAIPLHYSYSQGFLDVVVVAFGMIWVYSDGLAISGWSVLAALILSSVVVACAIFIRGHSDLRHLTEVWSTVSALLLILPLFGISHPAAQDPTWQGSPYLFPSGFCMMLLLLFVILPAILHLFDAQHQQSHWIQAKILCAVMLGVCLLLPFAIEDNYGLLGFSEKTVYWGLFRLTLGRWGLTNEVTFELTDSVQWYDLLLAYPIGIVLVIGRMMLAGLFTAYLTGRVSLRGVVLGAVTQEALTLCAVLISGTRAIPTPFTVWTLLPLPVVLPACLFLVWAWIGLERRIEAAELDAREYVTIPLVVRIRSLFIRKRRR